MPRWSGAASRSQGMWGRGKERDCLRGRGGGGEGEGVWLPSRSADYRWRGLRGAVLQVPGASVSSVPHDICSLLRSRGTLWRAHAHANTSGWESENNKLLLSLPPWFSRSGRHTVALNNSWLCTDFSPSYLPRWKSNTWVRMRHRLAQPAAHSEHLLL